MNEVLMGDCLSILLDIAIFSSAYPTDHVAYCNIFTSVNVVVCLLFLFTQGSR